MSRAQTGKIMFRESEEFYHNLIAQVKDYAIFTTDPRGVITTWNEGCKNVLGYDRGLMRKGGERFWSSGITTGVRNEVGNLMGFTKVLRDLTERKQIEERLHQSQMFFRMLAE